LLCFLLFIFGYTSNKKQEHAQQTTTTNQEFSATEQDNENTSQTDQTIDTETFTMPILGFHHIGIAPASLSSSAKEWYVSTQKFIEILDLVAQYEYTPITAADLVTAFETKHIANKPIMITFDDGNIDFYTTVFPIIKERNIPVTLAIMTGVGGKNYVIKEQLKEMNESGLVDIQSHTKYHAYLTRISKEERMPELQDSKAFIENLLGKKADVLFYPFGLHDDDVITDAQEAGYTLGVTIIPSTTQYINKPFELQRNLIVEYTNVQALLE